MKFRENVHQANAPASDLLLDLQPNNYLVKQLSNS
jgi:hypothetical protein